VFNAAGQETGFFAPVTDHLGTVRALLDQSEAVHQYIDDNSFGEITEIRDIDGDLVATSILDGPPQGIPNTAALDTVFGFAGRPLESATGLSQNRERWYDPHSGRFVNEDPARDGREEKGNYSMIYLMIRCSGSTKSSDIRPALLKNSIRG
jgi:RHS repeat-associated protein